jgi:predicted Zn-dependent peptidase
MMDTKVKNPNWKILKISILAILLNFSLISADAQEKFQQFPDTLSLDNSIRHGRLPNGFTYFIKSVPGPQYKLFMRLYNKAGSNQEDIDQFSVAHAVEHLAYKATQNFPSGIGNSTRIDKLGMEMYDYITAFSAPRATIYHFDAPYNNTEALQVGLLYFKDIATRLKLKETDINSVRGELRQELLSKVGDDINKISTASQMYSKIFPCNEDYFNFIESNGNFSSEAVKRFYKDWYRPDLMAISIVGNIDDPVGMESLVMETYSDIKPPKTLRKEFNCDSAYYSSAHQFAAIEKQMDTSKFLQDSTAKIHLFYRDTSLNNSDTKQSIDRLIKFKILVDLVANRFYEATNKYQSFDVQISNLSEHNGMPRAMELIANVENNQEKQVLGKTVEILNQLQKYGVSDFEWVRYKEKQIGFIKQRNNENADYWIEEISKYYIEEEALPSEKKDYLKYMWGSLSLSEINQFISAFLLKTPEDIGIIAPSYHSTLSWYEKDMRSLLQEEFNKMVKPYKQPVKPESLIPTREIETLKEKGYLKTGIGESGVVEVVLKNGIKLALKSFKPASVSAQSKIKIHGYSLRGANSFSKESYFSAINAAAIVRNSGVNGMDKFELNRFLAGTSLRAGSGYVIPYVKSQESGIQGLANADDLETMLQLIYLYFTRPNKNMLAFEDWKTEEYKAYINPTYSLITTDFENKIGEITGDPFGKESTSGTKQFKSVAKTDFDLSYNLYHKIFGNASDFIFLISGDFEIEQVLPMLQKYLGNLPAVGWSKKEIYKPMEVAPITQGTNNYFFPSQGNYKIKNISYGTRFIVDNIDPNDWREQLKVEALGEFLRQKLWALRFEKNYSLYDVRASGIYNEHLNRFEIISYLNCEPKEILNIRKEIDQIYTELKSGLFSNEELKKSLGRMYSIYKIQKAEELKISSQSLYEHYRYGEPWVDPAEVEKFVESISVADIVEVANKYCNEENYYEFVMSDKKIDKLIK